MKTSDMAEILTTAFVSSWPSFQLTEPTVRLWTEAFQLMDRDSFWQVMKATLMTHTGNFPPTIGQVNATLHALVHANEPTEAEVWELLMKAIQGFGFYRPEAAREFLRLHGGERLVSAVRSFGWSEICRWRIEDDVANRAHFWRAYAGLKNRDDFKSKVGREAIACAAPAVSQIATDVVKRLEAK